MKLDFLMTGLIKLKQLRLALFTSQWLQVGQGLQGESGKKDSIKSYGERTL